ncbi:MAG: hypothetical protein DRR19_13960 [Candidatus Parabeggiatoa sp. nov. 1]|nr:MAG: hypothetical protein DRR19_13960 [Gammaproteobacteria bacterium]
MKWVKILGFALLNAILGIILFFSLAWLLPKYTGQQLRLGSIDFYSLVTYGVLAATLIGACIIESWKARLPFWGILIATVIAFPTLFGLTLALLISLLAT